MGPEAPEPVDPPEGFPSTMSVLAFCPTALARKAERLELDNGTSPMRGEGGAFIPAGDVAGTVTKPLVTV